MVSIHSLDNQILRFGAKNDIVNLQKLIEQTTIKELTDILRAKLERKDCTNFWNYLLQSFNVDSYEAKEKRFACVKFFLDCLQTLELSYKQTYDLITRLCQDLNTFKGEELVEMLDICMSAMRAGDPKCVGWKDLLPEIIQILNAMQQINVNSIVMNGKDYRNSIVLNLISMCWPTEVITPIANMFKDLNLINDEKQKILYRFANKLQEMAPTELPALAVQLFSMCETAAQIIIPLLAMEKYFHRYYYKKLFMDMNSNSTDFDSIDKFSDKELREAEETIIHLLNYCTQYKISELQLVVMLKNFQMTPDVILTPFMISAILSMSIANREPDSCLTNSPLLSFLRSVIKNNEDERALADYSVWCRDCLQRKQVDLEQIFTVLIDQNKDGKDVITPGLVNLAFVLLKSRNNNILNKLAIKFLTKFIRKRFVFGQGVVKRLAEWMIAEQEQYQYSECLTMLSIADTFTVSECFKTINYVMDNFLWVDDEQAMRMMSFILPILKISAKVRDAFIDVLRKTINLRNLKICRMSVYGFCMILKQLNNSNAQRSQMSASGGAMSLCTQHTISGFSLMSQMTFGTNDNPQRHFNMLTLEIIGLLRNCFNQTLAIKCTLYENLQRAVELNPKLAPHVLQFIDLHFRSYFQQSTSTAADNDLIAIAQSSEIYEDVEFSIKFNKIVYSINGQDNEIEVTDNLGCLVLFISHCLVIFDKFQNDYDTREMKMLLNLSVEKIISRDLKFDEPIGALTALNHELLVQQLNLVESLMAYELLTSQITNDNVKHLLPLFKVHQKLMESYKAISNKKAQKKTKNTNESEVSNANMTINGLQVKKINKNLENIWDLAVIEKFLRLLHEDIVPFADSNKTTTLRSNISFVRYVFEVAVHKIETIRHEPEYKQLTHSKRIFRYLTDITKVIYERCIKRLPELWRDFDLKTAVLAAECFQQCLQTANETYKNKFTDDFIKGFDLYSLNNCKQSIEILQEIIDICMKDQLLTQNNENAADAADTKETWKITQALFLSLEVLYDNISYGNRLTIDSYTWLLNFCKEYKIEVKELQLVHKLLFIQRQKTHLGAFFNTIAYHLGIVWGFSNDDDDDDNNQNQNKQPFKLKSITAISAESCLNYLYATLRKQIEDVDYFIAKANNLNYRYRVIVIEDSDNCMTSLRSMEHSICSQLVHISNTLLTLTNVCIPLGIYMDNLLKLLMQHYSCLKNLAKHFLSCCTTSSFSINSTRFDLLLKVVGKKLPANIYELITYIESNILKDGQNQKVQTAAEKAKVLRETKLIPKLILYVENFNKTVLLLSKKSNERLVNFLHFGTVRDFRMHTKELRAAIERTLTHSNEIEVDSSVTNGSDNDTEEPLLQIKEEVNSIDDNNDNDDDDDDDEENNENVHTLKSVTTQKSKKTRKRIIRTLQTDDDDDDDDEDLTTPEDLLTKTTNAASSNPTQLYENLEKINKKAKKRSLRESEKNEIPTAQPQPLLKKRRARLSKK